MAFFFGQVFATQPGAPQMKHFLILRSTLGRGQSCPKCHFSLQLGHVNSDTSLGGPFLLGPSNVFLKNGRFPPVKARMRFSLLMLPMSS